MNRCLWRLIANPVLVCLSLTIDDQSWVISSSCKDGFRKGFVTRFWPMRLEGNWLWEFWNSVSVLRRHRKRGPFFLPDVVMSRYDARIAAAILWGGTRMSQPPTCRGWWSKRQKDPGSWQPCWARLQPTRNQQDASLLGEKDLQDSQVYLHWSFLLYAGKSSILSNC